MYIERVNVGPICTACVGSNEYCVSPAVKNVLACKSREGDMLAGRFVERLAPEVVIARLIRGTASSIRLSKLRISCIISLSSMSF